MGKDQGNLTVLIYFYIRSSRYLFFGSHIRAISYHFDMFEPWQKRMTSLSSSIRFWEPIVKYRKSNLQNLAQ